MKAGIHPNYQPTVIKCACGATIETGSTRPRKAAVQPIQNTHGVKMPHIRKKTAPEGAVLNLFKLLNAVLLVELINAAAGIDQLLLAGVEGVALVLIRYRSSFCLS